MVNTVGMGVGGVQAGPPGEPQSIGQLLSMVLKGILKTLPLQIALGGVMFLGVWVVHTYLLIGPNGGFDPNGGTFVYWLLGQVLALQGRLASGTAFWAAFSALGGAVVTGLIRRKGAFFSDFGLVPGRISRSLAGGNAGLAAVMTGVGSGILVPGMLGNRVFAVIAGGMALLALAEGPSGFGALILRCVYNDGRKALSKPPARLAAERTDGLVGGFAFGAVLYALMFLMPDFMLTGLGVIAIVAAIVLGAQGGSAASGTTGMLIVAVLALTWVRKAYGDDGGYDEAGGTFIGWVQSAGALQAITMGLSPAMAAALGAIIGALGPTLGGQFVAGIMPGLTGPLGAGNTTPPPPPAAPVMPPAYPPEVEWTGPDGVTRVLTYDPRYGGYINNLTGGFVDPANIDGWKQSIGDATTQRDAWRAHNAEVEASGPDAMHRAMADIDARLKAAQAANAADTAAWQKWFRDQLAVEKARNEAAQAAANSRAQFWTRMTQGAEVVETGADIGVNILATVTGPVGKSIKTAYTVTKDITKNVSQAHAQGTSLINGAGKGVLEAGFDVGFDKLKGTKAVQRIPGFGKYAGGNLGGESLGTIEKAIAQTLPNVAKENMIRDAFRDGFKAAGQSQVQKWLVKDPLKKALGLK